MIMNNYHMIDISTGYTHACLITYMRCTTAGSLSDYLYPSYMLAQPTLDYTEASDLYDAALEGTNSSYTEDNLSYESWIAEWTSRLAELSDRAEVPAEATLISTPLKPASWLRLLQEHPNKPLVNFFMLGISQGFRIGFIGSHNSLKSARTNLGSALRHPQVVEEYLAIEVSQYRVAGPFDKAAVPRVHISRFGVIPKGHQPNKWRLIVDLSHPTEFSVNDGIPKHLCSLSYITIDTAIRQILDFGPGTLLAKIDIKSAFRLLPVLPADRHLLAMQWNHQIYIDMCLPFGLRSAPKLFNILADFLSWIVEQKGVSPVLHYLDDFLIMAPPSPDSRVCLGNLNTFKEICSQLGIPLAEEKLEGPSQRLTFLGIVLDTQQMEARLPEDKLSRIRTQLSTWLGRRKATKREILSLVGLLQHATGVVRPGRTFVSRMYNTAAKIKELHYYTTLTKAFKSDLHWWHFFVNSWNGVSFLECYAQQTSFDCQVVTDASGSWGCGAQFKDHWFQYAWPDGWLTVGIMAKELVPIVIGCAVWGPLLVKKDTELKCDNQGLVDAVNKGSSKDEMVMHLLRCLWFFTAFFNIRVTATHIRGVDNSSADMLSRNQAECFLSTNPQASRTPTPLPPPLLLIVSPSKSDWTSPLFQKHFEETIAAIQP